MHRPTDHGTSTTASPIYAILAAGRDALGAATASTEPAASADATRSAVSPIFDRLAGRRLSRRQPNLR